MAESGKHWLAKVARDLRAASALLDLRPSLLDMAGFHCQQAIEKCLKAHLAIQRQKIRKIHDLRALYDLAVQSGLDYEMKPSVLDQISYCAVIVRYPDADDGQLSKRAVSLWLKIANDIYSHLASAAN